MIKYIMRVVTPLQVLLWSINVENIKPLAFPPFPLGTWEEFGFHGDASSRSNDLHFDRTPSSVVYGC